MMFVSNTTPVLAVAEKNLVPVSEHLQHMMDIPPSRMFLINKSLKAYQEKNPGARIFDASQGDGGASLPGVPRAILERAIELQIQHGSAYDMPFGTEAYRKSVIEQYWKLDSSSGWGPANVLATAGGRDALVRGLVGFAPFDCLAGAQDGLGLRPRREGHEGGRWKGSPRLPAGLTRAPQGRFLSAGRAYGCPADIR